MGKLTFEVSHDRQDMLFTTLRCPCQECGKSVLLIVLESCYVFLNLDQGIMSSGLIPQIIDHICQRLTDALGRQAAGIQAYDDDSDDEDDGEMTEVPLSEAEMLAEGLFQEGEQHFLCYSGNEATPLKLTQKTGLTDFKVSCN